MKEGFITVVSAGDATLVINVPDMAFKKVWPRRDTKLIIERDKLEEAFYYSPTVEFFFRSGLLYTTDKQFLQDVGLMDDDDKLDACPPLTVAEMEEMLGKMTLPLLKKKLATLSEPQLENLGDFAVEHSDLLKMDRIDLLSQVTGKNIAKVIENSK